MRDFLAAKIHSKIVARRSSMQVSNHVTAVLNAIVRVILHVAGFALLTLAAFQWNMIAGLAVAGISCFVFSTLMTGGKVDEREGGRAPDMRTGR